MRPGPMSFCTRRRRFPRLSGATPPTAVIMFRPPQASGFFSSPARLFSTSRPSMTASKIDGTAIARSIRERLGAQIKKRQETNPRYRPSLKIMQGKQSAPRCADTGTCIGTS
jgi:hypothetical protein